MCIRDRLETAWAERQPDYRPRTRHFNTDGSPQYTNRLYLEASPYLQQHAHNPVNWYPWSDEAFEAARRLNRPVLLSVGYSTCHWCHVMEEESFEDEEIATYLNENYVAIKVDREERPDIDAIYMSVVQMLTGQGGWPMTVWLTPAREAYSGTTYVPARDGDRGARIGFFTMLERLKVAYDRQPDQVAAASAEITRQLVLRLAPIPGDEELNNADTLDTVTAYYDEQFDDQFGGLQGTQKFPSGLSIRLMLRQHRRTGDVRALDMATQTLEQMASGGIYDQVGGGFHRYSTDARWLVPHFEKMLYDQAALTMIYLEGYQVTGDEVFESVVRGVLDYVLKDMTGPKGGFYSAEDADSEGEEGTYYVWSDAELRKLLTLEEYQKVYKIFGITSGGNFEETGKNILHLNKEISWARSNSADVKALKDKLLRVREKRERPFKDDKVLTAWNGLMISALAKAAQVLQLSLIHI